METWDDHFPHVTIPKVGTYMNINTVIYLIIIIIYLVYTCINRYIHTYIYMYNQNNALKLHWIFLRKIGSQNVTFVL